MSLRAKSKYVLPGKPAANSGVTLYCSSERLACHLIRLVLAEKEVQGARIEMQVTGRFSEDLLLLNPDRQLPTLVDRDLVLYPAAIVAEYLDERYPHPRLLPQEPGQRARLRMALLRFTEVLFPLVESVAGAKAITARNLRKQLAEQLIASHRLVPARGASLGLDHSLVDCAWTVLLWRVADLDLAMPSSISAPLRSYAERLFARPAFAASRPPAPAR